MGWGALLFGFSGRINRAKYWLASLLLIPAFMVLVVVVALPFATADDAAAMLVLIPLVVILIGVIVCGLAIATKRLHDRDKSAWWLLLFYLAPAISGAIGDAVGDAGLIFHFIGFAISIWGLIELGFLRGTTGPNRFGLDPLATAGSRPVGSIT